MWARPSDKGVISQMNDKIVLEAYHILMLLVPLVVFFSVLWRTWIGPQIKRHNEFDKKVALMEQDIKSNQHLIEKLELDGDESRRRLYAELNAIKLSMASIDNRMAHIEGRLTAKA